MYFLERYFIVIPKKLVKTKKKSLLFFCLTFHDLPKMLQDHDLGNRRSNLGKTVLISKIFLGWYGYECGLVTER